jgi:hypothetical protein
VIFHTRPDRLWETHPASYILGTGSFPRVKRPERGVDHPPSYSAEVKARVGLYLYYPSGPSWPLLGLTLPLPVRFPQHPLPCLVLFSHSVVCYSILFVLFASLPLSSFTSVAYYKDSYT